MKVKRIVADLHAPDPAGAAAFYRDVLGLDVLMDQGWIVTFGTAETSKVQVNLMAEGGSGTPVPDLSVEVDDLAEAHRRCAAAGIEIVYGPAVEPWGVERFFVRDPAGKLVNILQHLEQGAG